MGTLKYPSLNLLSPLAGAESGGTMYSNQLNKVEGWGGRQRIRRVDQIIAYIQCCLFPWTQQAMQKPAASAQNIEIKYEKKKPGHE